MGCSNCGEKKEKDCGCTTEALSINQICNPIECPADECAESFSAACIRYTGAPLICNNVEVVPTDTNVAQALSNILAFVCTNDVVENDILCGQTVVVSQGTELGSALGLIVAYFCNQLTTLEDLACPQSPVLVPANTSLNEALQAIFEYFCQQITDINIAISQIIIPEVIAGSGINVIETLDGSGNVVSYTIELQPIAFPVTTLSSAGGTETLVNDGTGTTLAIKGLTAGPGITLTSSATAVTISLTNPTPATLNYGLYAQTDDGPGIFANAPAGTLIGTGVGTLSVPANTFQVGDSFRVVMGGHLNTSNGQELTISVYANGNVIGTTNLINMKNATNKHWVLTIDFTIRSLGVTGQIVSLGHFSYIPDPAGQAFEGSDFSVVSTIDTTILNTLDIRAGFNIVNLDSIFSEYLTLNKTY